MKVDACWSVAAGLAVVDTTRGAVFQSRHFRLALSAGEVTRIHRALCMEIMFVATAGPAADQRLAGLNAALRELSPRIDTPYARAMEQLAAGVSDYLAGRWGTAAGPVAEGERILRDQCTGVTWELDTARFFRWWSLYQLGELKTLIPEFPSLLNDAEQRGDLYASTTIGGLFAHVIHLAHGDPAMASRHTAEAIARWGEHGFNMPHLWEQWSTADIAIYQRSGAEAYHRLVALWPLLDRSLLLRVEFTRVSMLDLRARAALSGAVTAAGRQREAFCGEALRCAEELHRRRGDWPSALALLITAGVSALRGEVQVALDRFARAEQLFKAIGMQLHTMVAQRRRGELSGGSGGEADITAADRWMAEQGITDTVAFSGMLSPR